MHPLGPDESLRWSMGGENFENTPLSMENRWCRSVTFYHKCNGTLRSAFLRKKQLQGSRKPARGTKGEVEAFDCDKSANLKPKNVKKAEIWPKRHPKCERTRAWKCKMTVYGTIPSVVDPQDTNCNFCSGLRQPGADTVRKTFDFWHFRAEKVH